MSRDIRSFFKVLPKKTDSSVSAIAPVKKKPAKIIDSDDENIINVTPEVKQVKNKRPKCVVVMSSDSEDEGPKNKTPKKPEVPKLKPAEVSDVFKNTPIKQSEVKAAPTKTPEKTAEVKEKKKSKGKGKKGGNEETKVHKDEDFEKTLMLLDEDDDIFARTLELLDEAEAKQNGNAETNKPDENTTVAEEKPTTSERKRSRTDSGEKSTPIKKKKMEHTDSGIDPGQEAHEKKRYSALLYQKYLNRSGPKHHGQKEMPNGKPNCLSGLCFMRTGVLDSLESEEFLELIKKHGGRTVNSVSRKVNYVVVGEEPGPAKLAKADSYNIPQISEDELLDLILTKSGKEAKYCQKDKPISENLEMDFNSDDDFSEIIDQSLNKQETAQAKSPDKPKTAAGKSPKKTTPEKETKKSKTTPEKSPEIPKKSTPESSKETRKSPKNLPKPEQFDPLKLTLTEKYKPADLKGIIGQQGDNSNVAKLKRWLLNWHRNQRPEVRKKLAKPSPWSKSDDGAYFKCALLSGSPGVGKTTTATLVAKDLGLDIVEFNASDTRSKRLLHEEVSQLLHTKSLAGFATGCGKIDNNRVLLMDEVDGMAGNEDRGGIQELINLIKTTNVPIICMCNDRNHQKMRSLVNYCYDLKFSKPRAEQIRGAMMSICFKEGINIPANALLELINGTGCDVRQTLNNLALLSTNKTITVEDAEKKAKSSKKDTVLGPWEVCRAVFTEADKKDMSIYDQARLFFYDYSLGPLFVQENYLKVQPKNSNPKTALRKAALAADSISCGDLIDSKIRKSNNWSLLEVQAFFSSVIPGHLMSGAFTGQINFPSWLGKNAKKNKFARLLGELQAHTSTTTCANKTAIQLDYLVPLTNAIIMPLKTGMDGIAKAVDVMKSYNLLRDDFDSLLELVQWNHNVSTPSIDTKVKTAFTRLYNKEVTLLPFAPQSAVARKRAAARDDEEEDAELSNNEDDDDITNNAMIKIKKPSAKGKKAAAETSSNATENKKGKGKGKKTQK